MGAGVWNVLVGIAAIAAGLSGRVAIFTNSSTALIVIGAAIALLGVYQLIRSRKES